MSYSDIYDFESIVETAVASVFEDNGLVAFTSSDAPDIQRDRPRCEITYLHGQGMNRFAIIGGDGFDYRREACWRGTLKIDVLTTADHAAHNSYRAKVRSLMANIWTLINGTKLLNHKLQFVSDGGTTPKYAPQDGYYASSLIYNTDLSVQADAWALLANNDE